jgi:N-methylhydantoinase A
MQLLAGASARVGSLHHATTAVTNCILERSGARTALITTRGFRDVLEIGRLRVPAFFDLEYVKPEPLALRRHRFEISERIGADGGVVEKLDEAELDAVIGRIAELGIESVAVSLINSYANDEHEVMVGSRVAAALPGVSLTLSSALLKERGEYERTSTAVVNAYVQPVLADYLGEVASSLHSLGVTRDLLAMNSSGELISFESARDQPAFIAESGPAAGVVAAHRLAEATHRRNMLTFDMGGTTAKASLIEDGRVLHASELEVGGTISFARRLVGGAGFPIRHPVIDLAEVGAGGGSIAWFDDAEGLHVGPRSAGAEPGPACYGLGGEDATVTDANLVLGYLPEAGLAGGSVALHSDLARAAVQGVGERVGLSVEAAAGGIRAIAIATMVRAIKSVSTERGRAPRDFDLIAFGGNGPLFGADVADALGICTVVVPMRAGVFSAMGLLAARVADEFSFAARLRLSMASDGDLAEVLGAAFDGFSGPGSSEARIECVVDLRYVGQRTPLPVPLSEPLNPHVADVLAAFHAEHERTYDHADPDREVELVGVHLTRVRRPGRDVFTGGDGEVQAGGLGSRSAWFAGIVHEAVLVYGRNTLRGTSLTGPAFIDDYDSTILVPPGWQASLDELGDVILRRDQS